METFPKTVTSLRYVRLAAVPCLASEGDDAEILDVPGWGDTQGTPTHSEKRGRRKGLCKADQEMGGSEQDIK